MPLLAARYPQEKVSSSLISNFSLDYTIHVMRSSDKSKLRAKHLRDLLIQVKMVNSQWTVYHESPEEEYSHSLKASIFGFPQLVAQAGLFLKVGPEIWFSSCSFREPKFNSQNPCQRAHNLFWIQPRGSGALSGFLSPCTHVCTKAQHLK